MRNLQTDFCGPGGDWQNSKRHPGQITDGQNSGEEWQEMLSWGRSISGQLKNPSSILREDCEESILLTLRTRSSKKPPGMLERNWNANISRYPLQDKQEHSAWDDPWWIQWDQINTCVYFGSQWIHKTAYGRIFTELWWRPYRRKKGQFTATLQFGTQISFYASSNEDTRSKGSSG